MCVSAYDLSNRLHTVVGEKLVHFVIKIVGKCWTNSGLDETQCGDGQWLPEVELESGATVIVVDVGRTQARHSVASGLAKRLQRHVANDGSVANELYAGKAPHVALQRTRVGSGQMACRSRCAGRFAVRTFAQNQHVTFMHL